MNPSASAFLAAGSRGPRANEKTLLFLSNALRFCNRGLITAVYCGELQLDERAGGFMPWTGESFRSKHNKKLSAEQAREAAKIANAILRDTGDEAKAIRIANTKLLSKPRCAG
jgi:hypothetical protein